MCEEAKPGAEIGALVEQGERLFEVGKPAEALKVFEQAVARAPLSATVHCNLGAVRWALGRVEEALAGFRRALELAPDHLETALNLARALTAMGRREEAALVARGFLALRPDADGFREFVAGAEGPRPRAVSVSGAKRLSARTGSTGIRMHLVVLSPPEALPGLSATLDSLAAQRHPASRVTVVSGMPRPDSELGGPLEVEWVQVECEPMGAVNRLVEGSSADWIGLLDAGDLVEPDMLSRCAGFLRKRPECRLIYMDEDRIDTSGGHHHPQFKPDFNLELLRSMPYLGCCLLARRDELLAIGGLAAGGSAAGYDLALRIGERGEAKAVGHVPWVLVHRQDGSSYDDGTEEFVAVHRRVLEDHLSRTDIDARVHDGGLAGTFFVDYAVPAGGPQVDIVIDGNAPPEVLSLTIEHVLQKTGYPAFRIALLVPWGSDPDCAAVRDERVRRVSYDGRHGLNQAIEAWVRATDAPYLLFLRPGVVPLRGNWLARLLGPMQRAEVVLTAPRLVSTDNQVIDGGILLGGGGYSVGAIAHCGLALDAPGYMGRAQVAQELGAVTDNCLLIRTDAYRAAGGFSSTIETPLYRVVDLCRRVAAGGGAIVWTPHATLLYVEAAASEADRLARERAAEREAPVVCRRWLPELARDPAYNPNLSLRAADFRVVEGLPSPAAFDSSRPRILGFGATSFGSWKYRVDQPLEALHREGLAHRFLIDFSENGIAQLPTVAELERLEVDALLFHNAVHDYALDALRLYRQVNHAFVVLGEDDLMTALPPKNPYSKTVYKDIRRRIRRGCELVDRVVVTTEPLAEALRRYSEDVRVIPNGLPAEVWGSLPRVRRRGGRPRVGWAGAPQHHGDLELLREVVEATATEVDWVFFGMCPDFLRAHAREVHDPVSFDAYPGKLASLELDLALAPLERNDFNCCKSNLRLLEYGVLGWPVIASDIEPYRDAPVCRVRNQARTWIQAIRERIHDLDAAACEGEALRQWVLANGMLEGRLTDWLGVLTA
jgi:glycosyltransferase involved in cell wall biosynthesis